MALIETHALYYIDKTGEEIQISLYDDPENDLNVEIDVSGNKALVVCYDIEDPEGSATPLLGYAQLSKEITSLIQVNYYSNPSNLETERSNYYIMSEALPTLLEVPTGTVSFFYFGDGSLSTDSQCPTGWNLVIENSGYDNQYNGKYLRGRNGTETANLNVGGVSTHNHNNGTFSTGPHSHGSEDLLVQPHLHLSSPIELGSTWTMPGWVGDGTSGTLSPGTNNLRQTWVRCIFPHGDANYQDWFHLGQDAHEANLWKGDYNTSGVSVNPINTENTTEEIHGESEESVSLFSGNLDTRNSEINHVPLILCQKG